MRSPRATTPSRRPWRPLLPAPPPRPPRPVEPGGPDDSAELPSCDETQWANNPDGGRPELRRFENGEPVANATIDGNGTFNGKYTFWPDCEDFETDIATTALRHRYRHAQKKILFLLLLLRRRVEMDYYSDVAASLSWSKPALPSPPS